MPSTDHPTHHADPAVAVPVGFNGTPVPAENYEATWIRVCALQRALHAKRDAWDAYEQSGPRNRERYEGARAAAVEARGALEDFLLGAPL